MSLVTSGQGKVGQDKSGSRARIELVIGSDVNRLIILQSRPIKRGKPERDSGRKGERGERDSVDLPPLPVEFILRVLLQMICGLINTLPSVCVCFCMYVFMYLLVSSVIDLLNLLYTVFVHV